MDIGKVGQDRLKERKREGKFSWKSFESDLWILFERDWEFPSLVEDICNSKFDEEERWRIWFISKEFFSGVGQPLHSLLSGK